jgi:solute carrier family 25 citrate transporter 1
MPTANSKSSSLPNNTLIHLIAGGIAGMCEALSCHPLDTIKVRMQLTAASKASPLRTAASIVKNEGPFALYKGLGAVISAIVPKMSIRFVSFEAYKGWLRKSPVFCKQEKSINFISGLLAGTTEAVLIVNPADVIKIRLQAQNTGQSQNAFQAFYSIMREEGPKALYRGITLTAARQATNQAVNFTVYNELKRRACKIYHTEQGVPPSIMMLMGLVSGAMGPIFNAPIDTIKTHVQKDKAMTGASASRQISQCCATIWNRAGLRGFYRGLIPRVMRVAPGQAVIFVVYERVSRFLKAI